MFLSVFFFNLNVITKRCFGLLVDFICKIEVYSSNADVKVKCLSVNQDLRKKLAQSCKVLFAAEEKNQAKKKKLETLRKETEASANGYDGKIRKSKPISLFAAPYFRDVKEMCPPDNEDTLAKLRCHDVTAYLQPPRPWIKIELDELKKGVVENAANYIMKQHRIKLEYYRQRLKTDTNLVGSERKKIKFLWSETKEIIKAIRKQPSEDIINKAKGHIDWMEIAATYLKGDRSDEECEAIWNNYACFTISKQPFTPEEDARLVQMAKDYNGRNWDTIAEKMQTGRSAIQCFERYQTCLNKALIKKYWTPKEDARLMEVVEMHRIGNFIPWNKVSSYMEGRERHQIINRYERTINKEIKRTPWTKGEDAMLLACVSKFGSQWSKMKQFFPGRNTYTLRERYVNILDPSIKCVSWTKKEDKKLFNLVKKYGFGKWSKISKELGGRTDNNCLSRAKYLGINEQTSFENGEKSDDSLVADDLKPNLKTMRWSHKSRFNIQVAARKTLQDALEKITPTIDENIDCEDLNLSSISIGALKELHKELTENENIINKKVWKPRYLSFDGVNKRDFSKSRKRRKLKIESETEEEIDEQELPKCSKRRRKKSYTETGIEIKEEREHEMDEYVHHDEEKFDVCEKGWLHKILLDKIKEESSLIRMPSYTKRIDLNSRESAECFIYEAYLKQKMMCSRTLGEEDMNCIFRGNDYNVSLADIVNHFVQPSISENNPMMILPPNWTTLTGMDMIQVTDSNLRRTATFVDHNKAYIGYLIGYKKDGPKCIKCCNAENAKTCKETFDVVVNAMKSCLIVPDEEMKTAAMVETRQSDVQVKDCCCEELSNSTDAIHLLTNRFISLFLWPFLLATLNITAKQEELIFTKRPVLKYEKIKNFKKSPGIVKRKPKNNIKTKIYFPSSTSTLRRSQRSCVLQRKSFNFTNSTDENETTENSAEE
ncbi:myb-related protein A [Nephila pilipes]|uniref:Myb-related protein A n=1 Tax=Nephila pilipes TaxID=299642 RepID=A0A8X6N7Y2_NEPPI|nr:myb-related protein A [Nephila pilipes]